MERESFLYQEIPQNRLLAKNLTNWSAKDVYVLLLILLVTIATWVWAGALMSAIVALLILPFLVRFSTGYGRLYREFGSELRSFYLNRVLGGVWWLPRDKSRWPRRWLRSRRAIPLRLMRIQATIDGSIERFGLLQQVDRPYDHLFIQASGADFAKLDLNRQNFAVNELANITNQVILQTDLKVGISYLRSTSPFNMTELAEHLRVSMNPVITDPDLFELDDKTAAWVEWMRGNSNQLRDTVASFGTASTAYLIVITIKRAAELDKKRPRLSDRQLYELPIIELGRALVDGLRNSGILGLRDVHCLGLAELAEVVRRSWDIADIGHYNRERSTGVVPKTDVEIDQLRVADPDVNITERLRAWPTQTVRSSKEHDYIVFDHTYLSTIRVIQLPSKIRSDQFMEVHYSPPVGAWTRLSMVGQAVSGNAETNQWVVTTSALMNFNAAFFGNRIVQNPRFARKKRELLQQAEVISMNSVSQHFNMLIVVAADSEEELLRRRKQVQSSLNARGFRSMIVRGTDHQRDAVISGMLGVNRL